MTKYHIKIIFRNYIFYSLWPLFSRFHSNHLKIWFLKLFNNRIVGSNVYIACRCEIKDPWRIYIGSNVVINKNVLLDGRGGLEIGDNVDIAQDTLIWTAQHDYNDDYHKFITGRVIIHDYVWLASRTIILPGVTIGKGAVVAAGAVVTKNVDALNIVGGIPAHIIGVRRSKLLYTLHKESRKNK